jgi:hypothetical protein
MITWWRRLETNNKIALIALVIAVLGLPPAYLALRGRSSSTSTGPQRASVSTQQTTTSTVGDGNQSSQSTGGQLPSSPVVLRKGPLNVSKDYGVDLDADPWKISNADMASFDEDVYFNLGLSVTTANSSARFALINDGSANHSRCEAETSRLDSIDLKFLRKGSQICVYTSNSRLALLRVTALPSDRQATETISFDAMVWDS